MLCFWHVVFSFINNNSNKQLNSLMKICFTTTSTKATDKCQGVQTTTTQDGYRPGKEVE